MLSYFNHAHGAFIHVGLYWQDRPRHAPKDIPEARLAQVKLSELLAVDDKDRTI